METQKIVNLLNGSDNDNLKFATKKWYIIDSKGNYSHENPIKFVTSLLESSLCDYSDAYLLMIQLNNMMKLERYQQEKVMIILQVVC